MQKNDDMNTPLFPHKFQKPAILIFLLSQILVFVYLVVRTICKPESGLISDNTIVTRVALFLYVLVVYGSLFVMIFSKEKVEDEYISMLRLESVAIVAAVIICLAFIARVIQCTLPFDSIKGFNEMSTDVLSGLIIWGAIIYFCVFKYKLRHQS